MEQGPRTSVVRHRCRTATPPPAIVGAASVAEGVASLTATARRTSACGCAASLVAASGVAHRASATTRYVRVRHERVHRVGREAGAGGRFLPALTHRPGAPWRPDRGAGRGLGTVSRPPPAARHGAVDGNARRAESGRPRLSVSKQRCS